MKRATALFLILALTGSAFAAYRHYRLMSSTFRERATLAAELTAGFIQGNRTEHEVNVAMDEAHAAISTIPDAQAYRFLAGYLSASRRYLAESEEAQGIDQQEVSELSQQSRKDNLRLTALLGNDGFDRELERQRKDDADGKIIGRFKPQADALKARMSSDEALSDSCREALLGRLGLAIPNHVSEATCSKQ